MHKDLIFKAAVACGILLGALLLVQTVVAYRFVSSDLVKQEADRETKRNMLALEKTVQAGGSREPQSLQRAADAMVREMPAQVAWIRILRMDGSTLAAGGVPAHGIYTATKFQQANERHEPLAEMAEVPTGRVLVTARPFHPEAPRAGLPPPLVVEMGVYLNAAAAPFTRLRVISLVASAAAIALVFAMVVIGFWFPRFVRGKQIEEQLEVARAVQNDLIPTAEAVLGLDLAGECRPAWQVGGDFYDVSLIEKGDGVANGNGGGRIGLMLADVAGKGLPASLLSSLIQGAVSATSWTSNAGAHERATRQLNDLLCARSAGHRYASLFWCYYDSLGSTVRYVNAGHLPPVIVRKSRDGFAAQRLDEGGTVLGLLPGSPYRQGKANIEPGDLLVMFSDGITEAANAADEEFGEDRVIDIVSENWDREPRQICDAVFRGLRSFLGRLEPHDDQTLVIVRLKPVAPETEKVEAALQPEPGALIYQ